MAGRDLSRVLAEIAEAVDDVEAYVEGLDMESFSRLEQDDRRTFRAIKNAISEIGEAIKQLPPEFKAQHLHVDWRGLAGLRDIVAHAYFNLDTERLWPVLVEELPELGAAVRAASEPSVPLRRR